MLFLLEWMSTMENAPRLDLSGQPTGIVTATQAMHAKQQGSRQRGQDRRHRAKRKEGLGSRCRCHSGAGYELNLV
ncbi:hypothetical protein HG619_15885 [Pseudomonas syringae]|nr:hypothetical protein [Pseudomonas syringae]